MKWFYEELAKPYAVYFLLSYALVIALFAPFATKLVKASLAEHAPSAKNKAETLPACPHPKRRHACGGIARLRDGVFEQDRSIVFLSHGAGWKETIARRVWN